jgi:imidazolonepropionase-like amidohydrolase
MAKILFKNVNVLDCTGAPPYAGQVLVEGNRIKSVAPQGSTIPSEGAKVVDGGGATLMPGMVESHSHITFLDTPDLEGLGFVPPEEHMLRTVKNAKKMLDQGFTACNSAASAKPRLDVVLRNAINAGDFPGPRTLAASPEMTVTSGLGDVRMMHMHRETFAVICDGAEEFRKMSRLMVREGVDTLKINPSGDEFIPHARAHQTVMTEAEIAAVCDVGHASWQAHGRACAQRRVGQALSEARCRGYLSRHPGGRSGMRRAGSGQGLVLRRADSGNQLHHAERGAKWGITPQVAEGMGMRIELDAGIKNMKELKKRGVRVLPGGDYGFAWNPIGTNARDIEHFVNLLGFSPMDAIISATKMGGEIMKAGNEMGQVKPGYLADLILVDGNPVANVRLLQDASKLLMIMKDGQFHKEPQVASQSQRQIA